MKEFKRKWDSFWIRCSLRLSRAGAALADDTASAVVEGLLVLCVLIALAVIFRAQLLALVEQIFDSIRRQAGGVYH